MGVTGFDVVRESVRVFLTPGVHYGSFDCPHRCRPDQAPHCVDCSGLTSYVLNKLGVPFRASDCTGSFQQARELHAAGRGMSVEKAMRTPGALLFQGVNEGQGGIPGVDPGHVGFSAGDGFHTLEARGHYSGVGVFYRLPSAWDWAGMPVGVENVVKPVPVPPAPIVLPDVVTVQNEETLTMIVLPNTATTPHGEVATARAVPELDLILLESGARLKDDQPVAGDKSGTKRFWVPPKAAQVPGWNLLGIADLRASAEKAIVARYGFPNGDTGTYKAQLV